jgi:hypothetical protein
LVAFRFLTALGLGGEWGAASSLVYETVPHKRVLAACLIHTAAPGVKKCEKFPDCEGAIFSYTSYLVSNVCYTSYCQQARTWLACCIFCWFASCACSSRNSTQFEGKEGLGLCQYVKESDEWLRKNKEVKGESFLQRFKEHFRSISVLFSKKLKRSTIGGLSVVIVSLLSKNIVKSRV